MFALRFVWEKMKGGRWKQIAGLLLSAIIAPMVIITPYLTGRIIDTVIGATGDVVLKLPLGISISGSVTRVLLFTLLIMCAAVLLKSIFHFLRVVLMEQSSQAMLMNIRNTIFERVQHQDMAFFSKMRAGDIITRTTGDLEDMRHFCAWITYKTVELSVTLVAALVMMFNVNRPLTWAMLAVLPFVAFVSRFYTVKIRPIYRGIRESLSQLNVAARENIDGNRVVKAFAQEEYEKQKFAQRSMEYKKINLRANVIWQKFVPIMEFFTQLITALPLLVGGILVIRGGMTLGELTMFSSMTWVILVPINNLTSLLNDFQRFASATEKVIALTEEMPMIINRHDAIDMLERAEGEIEFCNVTFSYEGDKIFDGVDFKIRAGENIGIIGPTGGGKTTLVNLIARFIEPDEGKVLLDGEDIHMRTLSSVHQSIGIATQEVFLFSDTIAANIAFSDPTMSRQEVIEYAALAGADGFITNMPDGYDTIVGERGMGLSGGQRQRIALARALAAKPSILVLDDTTSALDMDTERLVQHNLRNLPFPCTRIVIAQRISSVRDADRIFVIEKGRLTIGTHESLMRENRYYRDVCELQDVADMPAFVGGNS